MKDTWALFLTIPYLELLSNKWVDTLISIVFTDGKQIMSTLSEKRCKICEEILDDVQSGNF